MPARTRIIALVLAVAALGAGAFAASLPAAAQATTTITVGDFWFCSSGFQGEECVTTVDAGDAVVWDFSGTPTTHTTTGDGWDSGNMSGGSFSFTFEDAGTFAYRCDIHPSLMMGQIEVRPAAAEEPTDEPEDGDATEEPADGAAEPTVVAAPVSGFGPQGGGDGGWWMAAALGAAGVALGSAGALTYRRSRN
jgi:plastocyanin